MVGAADMDPAEEPSAGDPETLTLGTICACGHERRDHRGLQMQARGPCLECRCDEFSRISAAPAPPEQEMQRIQVAFDQLERLYVAVARLHRP